MEPGDREGVRVQVGDAEVFGYRDGGFVGGGGADGDGGHGYGGGVVGRRDGVLRGFLVEEEVEVEGEAEGVVEGGWAVG